MRTFELELVSDCPRTKTGAIPLSRIKTEFQQYREPVFFSSCSIYFFPRRYIRDCSRNPSSNGEERSAHAIRAGRHYVICGWRRQFNNPLPFLPLSPFRPRRNIVKKKNIIPNFFHRVVRSADMQPAVNAARPHGYTYICSDAMTSA